MGTWIEIPYISEPRTGGVVVPSWARGLKCTDAVSVGLHRNVVPSWARGLKYDTDRTALKTPMSCPHGHVD